MADFNVNDRRGGGRRSANNEYEDALRKAGIKVRYVNEGDQQRDQTPYGDPRQIYDALSNRKLSSSQQIRRTGSIGSGMSLQMATTRPRDPMWYWKQNNIPLNFTDPQELQRIREFCNTPDAPVLMYDGTTKLLGDIVPGDVVMGWTYLQTWNGGLRRTYGPSTVLATNTRIAPNVVQLDMASGATIKCTADHKWHNPHFTKPQAQGGVYPENYTAQVARQLTEYLPATVGGELVSPTNIRWIDNPGNMFTSVFAGKMSISDTSIDKVVAITEIGQAEVVSMQTSTGNYIVWGYCSKNCRLLYTTHPVVSACIDVYSKLPMQGMAFQCKDPQLVDFYSELFFDQLNYEEHLLKLGRQYWLAGESWSLGGWSETLGIWEEEQLINPDNVEVEKTLFLREPRYLMKLPEDLRKILTTRQPHHEYAILVKNFPDLVKYAQQDTSMPVSNIVLQQMRFEADDFSNRGIPILMRAMRTLIQEEMLNSALDSIADRLYTPLILAKLGAKAGDLGTNAPWIPGQDEQDDFLASLDAAMAADFRVMAYHFALEMEPVFGRENVPDLSNDFDRIVERLLMVFGLSQTMLTGASAGETYAADALNRDVVTQLLSHYQKMQINFVRKRAEIVAEAQGHFDYETRNGKRYLTTEEIYEVDEESGEGRLVEIPKLLVPDLQFKILNLSDEEQERQFVETLAEGGVPVPYRARLQAAGIDFDEALEQRSAEAVALAVSEAETEKKIYRALKSKGLPIDADLRAKFDPKAIQPGQMAVTQGAPAPHPSLGEQQELPNLAPSPDDMDAEQEENQGIDPATGAPMDPNEGQDVNEDGEPSDRPEESDEEREDMPKAAALRKEAAEHNAAFVRFGRHEIVAATNEHYVAPDNSLEVDEEGHELLRNFQPTGFLATPKHVGMRKHVVIPERLRAVVQDPSDE